MFKLFFLFSFLVGDFFTGQTSFISTIRLVREIQRDIYAWDVDSAEKKLKKLPVESPFYHYLKGYILFYEGDYAKARDQLKLAVNDLRNDSVYSLYNLVNNTFEETKNFKKTESEHFVIYYSPGKDEILIPLAKDTLEKAWKNVGSDLGYFPEGKIRVEIYPFYESFMKISSLTRKDIETSGTIALCNYNRIMITSTRATLFGYRWRDTLNHEMVHYFLTKMTRNFAPLWLQEGVAKAEETRWRMTGPRPLSPMAQTVLLQALHKGNFVTFKEMIPSFAKLGSGERVTLAFAEVLSMVRMIIHKGGYHLLRKLILSSLKFRGNSEEMIKSIGYKSLKDFLKDWKNYLEHQQLVSLDYIPENRIALKYRHISNDYFRLGEMLKDRMHFASAAYEFEKAIKRSPRFDPLLYYKYAFSLYHAGKIDKAGKVLIEALRFAPDYESLYTLLGYVYIKQKNWREAVLNFDQSVDLNPFDPLIHRGLIEVYSKLKEPGEVNRERKILNILESGGRSD